ncbi:MAG: hypothetical protein JXR61_08115 [Prolixibacteraceae bacterium]|nr:hypothetical protein [Prolixibacteraceae bacterium]
METLTICPTSTATILACQKIAKAFKENIYELSSIRKEWDPAYATSLNIWIDDTIEKYFAENLDAIDDNKYREWHEVMIAGLQSLKILRASIKVDFKNDKKFLKDFFERTGYDEYFSDAKNGDHLSMCKFLMTFAENIDDETRKKIVEKGTVNSIFEKIIESAHEIRKYEDCFAVLEENADLNNYGKKEMTEVYKTIQDICRIAIAYYQFDPMKRDQFNFYKTLVNL